jgi:spore germination protein KA/spore germination protein
MLRDRKSSFGGSGADGAGDGKEHVTDIRFVDEMKEVPLYASLEDNKQAMKQLFQDCSDIIVKEMAVKQGGLPACIAFVDGLVSTDTLNDALDALITLATSATGIEEMAGTMLPVSQTKCVDNFGDLLLSVLGGDTAVFVGDEPKAIVMGIRGPDKRSVSEPETESVVRGPREGFTESIRTNTSLIRRKLRTPKLKMKAMTLGSETNTGIVVSYLEDLAVPSLIEEVEKRLKKIEIDGILESGYIEEFIQDNAYSPFPQIQYTERPDVVAAALMQGRIAILIDGTPFVLLVPFVFAEIMQASEDYYERFQIATLIRWLRYLFLILSLTTPALYVAILTYHQDLLPTSMLLSVAAARESIPFPVVVETLIMEITFEALREAGIRLPKTVGSAVSILGALVIGQAAVQAGIVSAPIVIVVSITGIASFTIPKFSGAIAVRMLRFPILIAGSLFGMLGVLLSVIFLLGHLANLRSFGVPYLSPFGPLSSGDLGDTIVRAPWWAMDKRPSYMPLQDGERLDMALPREVAAQGGQEGRNIDHGDDSKREGEST